MDVSNYTGPLTARTLAAWQSLGVVSVIVQSINPPPGYPDGVTRQQIEACKQAGLSAEAYVYLWTSDPGRIASQLDLIQDLGIDLVWLDCEDTMASTPAARIASIRTGLQIIRSRGISTGIYTGRWWWTAYVNDTHEFAAEPLWASIYDGIADRGQGFIPFGGFSEVTIKQYAGTSTLAGVGGVDLNVT